MQPPVVQKILDEVRKMAEQVEMGNYVLTKKIM